MSVLLATLPFVVDLLKRIIPDPGAQAEAQVKLAQLLQNGELAQLAAETDLAKGQMAINAAEAAQPRRWITWREAFGWMCVLTIGFKFVGGPGFAMLADLAGHPITLPVIDSSELWPALLGMLGLGSLDTVQKVKTFK